jgi:NADPH2:quinone reductase
LGTVRSSAEEPVARKAGAHEVILNDQTLVERVKTLAPEGVDHIVEVAFGANIDVDVEMLKMGGSIGAYATDNATPKIPFWLMVFKNLRLYYLGSDDFPTETKVAATRDLNDALQAGWPGFEIGERVPLSEIARAHELVEHPVRRGRVIVTVSRIWGTKCAVNHNEVLSVFVVLEVFLSLTGLQEQPWPGRRR